MHSTERSSSTAPLGHACDSASDTTELAPSNQAASIQVANPPAHGALTTSNSAEAVSVRSEEEGSLRDSRVRVSPFAMLPRSPGEAKTAVLAEAALEHSVVRQMPTAEGAQSLANHELPCISVGAIGEQEAREQALREQIGIDHGPMSEPVPRAELAVYMKKSFLRAGWLILGLVSVMGVLGTWFEHELMVGTEWLYDAVGTAGLLLFMFINDAVISPLPPEAALVIVAKTSLSQHWPLVILSMGILSALAGNVAWWLGNKLGDRFAPATINSVRVRYRRVVKRYGSWTVALAAITPLPFSIACMAAGALNMRYSKFWYLTLLRIPRFFLFYIAIAFSGRLLSMLF